MTAPTFEELLANIKAASTINDAVLALTEGLKMQTADVLSILKLPHAVAAELDLVFAKVREDIEPITEAIMNLETDGNGD